MRIYEIVTNKKRKSKPYVPPRNPAVQKRHSAQLKLGKQQAEFQQELIDLELKKKELEKEGDETIGAMADRALNKQRDL